MAQGEGVQEPPVGLSGLRTLKESVPKALSVAWTLAVHVKTTHIHDESNR